MDEHRLLLVSVVHEGLYAGMCVVDSGEAGRSCGRCGHGRDEI